MTLTSFLQGFSPYNMTQVPNAVFDDLMPDLTGSELKVLLYIIRQTFGLRRYHGAISIDQLTLGTGLNRTTIMAAVKGLEDRQAIIVERGQTRTVYRLNFIDDQDGVVNE